MKKTQTIKILFPIFMFILIIVGCKKDLLTSKIQAKGTTAGILPHTFDWETVNWMPTPSGQSLIPPPWIGQGSLSSVYDSDVVNDYKSADGWVLVYNTFDPNASGALVNPYFMLYNKYRGLLRVYIYTTTQFVNSSTYLQDGISIISPNNTPMLNFMGTDLIDVSTSKKIFAQIQPAPKDGSLPLASNKWYMLQYELAYDPQIANTNYQNIQMSWFTNYYGVSNISLGGNIEGTMTSTVGSASGTQNIFSSLANGGKVAGKAAIAGIGSQFLTRNTVNENTGENKIGLPNNIFKSALKGITGALTGSIGDIPGALTNIFSAIFGGSSAGTTTTFNVNATMTLNGTSTSGGSFPSSPTSVWVPGSIITPLAQNYVPLYNNTMGVFNLASRPIVNVDQWYVRVNNGGRPPNFTTETELRILASDNSNLVQINPAVLSSANVTIEKQEILLIPENDSFSDLKIRDFTGQFETVGEYSRILTKDTSVYFLGFITYKAAVRISLKVVPNNGAPASVIIKTFLADVVNHH